MQLIERFQGAASDGCLVEILKWGSIISGGGGEPAGHEPLDSTLNGSCCQPTTDGRFLIVPSGVNVRRIR